MMVISTNAMHAENGWTVTLFMLLSAILLDLHHHEHYGEVVVLVPWEALWTSMLTSSLEHNHAMMVAPSHVHLLKVNIAKRGGWTIQSTKAITMIRIMITLNLHLGCR